MNNSRIKQAIFSPWTPLLLAFLFRIALLGYENLWTDEIVTVRDSLKPISEIIGQRWDPHPPLYYLVLHYWLKINQTDAFTRLPSVLFGVISVFLIYRIGLRIMTQRAAWFMAMLLAVSPLHIWYSQETRMYAMVVMWGLASTYFWIMLLQDRSRHPLIWLSYIAVTSLGMYTHYTMLMVIIGQNIYTVARWIACPKERRNHPLKFWLLSQVLLVILYQPWFSELPKHWQIIRGSTTYPLWEVSTTPVLLGIAFLGLLGFIGLIIWLRKPITLPEPWQRLLITAVLAATILLFLLFLGLAMTNRLSTFKKQTLVLFPFLYIFLVYFLSINIKKWQYWATGLLVISLIVTSVSLLTLQKPRWREAVDHIQTQAISSDALVLNPSWLNLAFNYYLDQANPNNPTNIPNFEKIPLEQDFQNVWLITNTKFEAGLDPALKTRSWMLTHYEPGDTIHFGELEIIRFQNIDP